MCYNAHIVQSQQGPQVSRLGTGIVHPMFHLAAIAATFSCIDAQMLIDKINEFKIEEETRAEMISVVLEETPHCEWDAKAD